MYRVAVEHSLVVLAESCEQAEEVARDSAVEWAADIGLNGERYSAYQVNAVSRDWRNSIPYGDGNPNDLTCEEILAAIRDYEAARPATQEELEAAGQQRLTSSDVSLPAEEKA